MGVLYFVVGPTAGGKSAWALEQAQRNNGIIVNVDSIQFYKKLNIGSAKPTPTERSIVPHYLYDVVEPDENFTAGDFRRHAMQIIESHVHQHNIYFVGGSGFYFQALEKGMYAVPPIPEGIQNRVQELFSRGELYDELYSLDPQTAEKIGLNDSYRLQRALSLILSTGKKMVDIEAEFKLHSARPLHQYSVEKIGLDVPRVKLRERIQQRTEKMLSLGLLDEVRSLIKAGYGSSKALASVGYRECVQYLSGALSSEQLLMSIVTSTMQLAKKQKTWFKRDPEIVWITRE